MDNLVKLKCSEAITVIEVDIDLRCIAVWAIRPINCHRAIKKNYKRRSVAIQSTRGDCLSMSLHSN